MNDSFSNRKFYTMNKKKPIITNEILNSLSDIRRAKAPGFFYTRLRARMENELSVGRQGKRIWKPLLIISGFVIILLINGWVLYNNGGRGAGSDVNGYDKFQIVANDYRINNFLPVDLNQ